MVFATSAHEYRTGQQLAHSTGVAARESLGKNPPYHLLADAVGQPTTHASEPTSRPSLRSDPRAIRWRKTIFWSAIILFVGLVASVAIVRFSRRYADYLKDEAAAPTASEDVWSMHRLPPDAVEALDDDKPANDPDQPPSETNDDDNEPRPPS